MNVTAHAVPLVGLSNRLPPASPESRIDLLPGRHKETDLDGCRTDRQRATYDHRPIVRLADEPWSRSRRCVIKGNPLGGQSYHRPRLFSPFPSRSVPAVQVVFAARSSY